MKARFRSMVRGSLRTLPALCLITIFLPPQHAVAYHAGIHLEITPEVQSVPVGSVATLTAILVDNSHSPVPTMMDRKIDFENENGANDFDGTSRTTPDLSCVIPLGSISCTVELDVLETGNALIRGWIDTDSASVDNSDQVEGRFAGGGDCQQRTDRVSDCAIDATNGSPVPGTTCPGPGTPGQPPGTEPDCTDVIQLTFTESTTETLDCDDAGTPDTEHETNPPNSNASNDALPDDEASIETYTCTVRDRFGNPKGGETVQAEVENGINDPDFTDGASYNSPDFPLPTQTPCTTATRTDPATFSVKGQCLLKITQHENELGRARICFWVGTAAEAGSLCPDEEPGASQHEDGSDQPDNKVDVVELTWESLSDLALDCSPESGFSLVDNQVNVECLVFSPLTDDPVEGVKVNVEVTGANDPDDSDTPHTPDSQPDEKGIPVPISCESGPNGRCTIKHHGEDPGETVYRAWIDDENPEPPTATGADPDVDQTEGHNENTTPGTLAEPDSTDVVITEWGAGPASILTSPDTAAAAVNDCHEITVTATDKDGNPVRGVRIDIEQKHERSANSTPNDEPIVNFCTPMAGPNPSDVDTSLGDLEPAGGGPNTSGTAGGESVRVTDANGKVTLGVTTAPAHSSNGTGTVYITTWWESVDDDDPSGGEPMDSSFVTWEISNSATLELSPDRGSADPGSEQTYTATVTDDGSPVAGVQVSWAASGTGKFTWTEVTTDSAGQATATVTADDRGTMTVTVTCGGDFTCSDTSTQTWGPSLCDVIGTEGADVLMGTDASETICGFGGNDMIDGGGGDDVLLGGLGNDHLVGSEGLDELFGGGGQDKLFGSSGDDQLFGAGGPDVLSGGTGADLLSGDGGNDRLNGGPGNDDLSGGEGDDELVGGPGRDAMDGQAGRNRCRQESARSPARTC